jgi:hypothetical protein
MKMVQTNPTSQKSVFRSEIPKKKPRGGELSAEEKSENRRVSRECVLI